MPDIVTFSGWLQDSRSLENIASGANHIDYGSYDNIEKLFSDIKDTKCDILIGWSLGGQIALRAIGEKVLSPSLLVLIGTPYQFLNGDNVTCGVDEKTFGQIRDNFIHNKEEATKSFNSLIALNDSNNKYILKNLKNHVGNNWLYWLDELKEFSCHGFDFQNVPKTAIIHGANDNVISENQSSLFLPFIRNNELIIINNCGHAPHLHDPEKIKKIIENAYK